MFDIGFSQILIIALVAMIVIGPARLPKTVRTLGHLLGRMQRYVSEIKIDIQREMELEELKKVQQSMQDIGKDIEKSVRSVIQETEKTVKQAEGGMREVESELSRIADDKPAADKPAEQVAGEDMHIAMAAAEADTGSADATTTAETEMEVETEPPVTVPAFLQGEVALSIPDALPTSDRKPEA
ncbi:MAG: Sec-independent protein translocase protein TatB [Burkholderiales bacterium]|jgi:sec-independent protein translocase protein TatB|nr:Sec-independent protein translocase protein TatB [Burkholderiales bacterium]